MKTTKNHFEIFKREARRMIKELGLLDWDVYFVHEEFKKDSHSLAQCRVHYTDKSATLALNKDFEDGDVSPKFIRQTARHEVFHLLLARLEGVAKERFVNGNELYEADEEVVNRLENAYGEK